MRNAFPFIRANVLFTSTGAAVLWVMVVRLASATSPAADEMAEAHSWAAAKFEKGTSDLGQAGRSTSSAEPFFSFTYNGRPSAEVLKTWTVQRTRRLLDEKRTQHTLTYRDPGTGLVLRCVGIQYSDFPTVEWTLYFRNAGDKETPILADICPLDIQVEATAAEGPAKPAGEFRLHHHIGSPCSVEDYRPLEAVLARGTAKRITAAGGRPTNSHLSYFNLQRPGDEGLIIVVGWPGQWAADFLVTRRAACESAPARKLRDFKLLPGEEIRTPLMVLQFWKGDRLRAQNIWRRWMIAHNVPRLGGKLPPLLLSASSSYYFDTCTAPIHIAEVLLRPVPGRRHEARLLVDGRGLVSMRPDRLAEDGHLGSRHAAVPERPARDQRPRPAQGRENHRLVRAGTGPCRHVAGRTPSGMDSRRRQGRPSELGPPGSLGVAGQSRRQAARRAGHRSVSSGLQYRSPHQVARRRRADRQGMTEIKHVMGYLAYWDELRRRHPEMLIDTCASGGRRNDLETLRRAVPLLRSDHLQPGISQQCHTYGIASWMPYFGQPMQDVWDNLYLMRSGLVPRTHLALRHAQEAARLCFGPTPRK